MINNIKHIPIINAAKINPIIPNASSENPIEFKVAKITNKNMTKIIGTTIIETHSIISDFRVTPES